MADLIIQVSHFLTQLIIAIMKKILFYLTAVILLSCSKSKTAANKETEKPAAGPVVKVMTYNIYGARASSGAPADLGAIAKVINDQKPDLVALQEVDVFTNRTGKTVHQARDLAALTGMEWFFTKAIDQSGGEYGDAVLSRLPIKETKRYALPVADGIGGEFRSVAVIKINKEGKDFYFASTHLDHLAIEDSRILQAQTLKGIVNEINTNGGLILAGDLNATPDSKTIGIMKSYLNLGCLQQCPLTYPSDKPTKTIDYITFSPTNKFSVNSYLAIPYLTASDHAPIVSTITIK